MAGGSDRRFDGLNGGHRQSQVKSIIGEPDGCSQFLNFFNVHFVSRNH